MASWAWKYTSVISASRAKETVRMKANVRRSFLNTPFGLLSICSCQRFERDYIPKTMNMAARHLETRTVTWSSSIATLVKRSGHEWSTNYRVPYQAYVSHASARFGARN